MDHPRAYHAGCRILLHMGTTASQHTEQGHASIMTAATWPFDWRRLTLTRRMVPRVRPPFAPAPAGQLHCNVGIDPPILRPLVPLFSIIIPLVDFLMGRNFLSARPLVVYVSSGSCRGTVPVSIPMLDPSSTCYIRCRTGQDSSNRLRLQTDPSHHGNHVLA